MTLIERHARQRLACALDLDHIGMHIDINLMLLRQQLDNPAHTTDAPAHGQRGSAHRQLMPSAAQPAIKLLRKQHSCKSKTKNRGSDNLPPAPPTSKRPPQAAPPPPATARNCEDYSCAVHL